MKINLNNYREIKGSTQNKEIYTYKRIYGAKWVGVIESIYSAMTMALSSSQDIPLNLTKTLNPLLRAF